ncbi:MAG: VWA domain-containing protein [Acidobacteria bacterium]|nr:MAG: VWA domain-containing protein [Acidobacteriota bacterium]
MIEQERYRPAHASTHAGSTSYSCAPRPFNYRISATVTKFSLLLLAWLAQAQFRTTTELVSVDTIVTTQDGRPATDLTTKDFVLKVDGKARPIQSVQFVRFNAAGAGPAPPITNSPAGPASPASPFSTNTDPKGRTFIFAIDHNNIHAGNERPAIDAAVRLLDRLTPNDRVAVVTLPRGGVSADLSTDRAAARQALEGIIGHAPQRSSQFGFSVEEALTVFGAGNVGSVQSDLTKNLITEMVSRECGSNSVCASAVRAEAREYGRSLVFNTRDTILALGAFMNSLSSLEGTKSIVFVSEGLIETSDNTRDLTDLGRVADAARVRMFVLQLNTPMFDVGGRKAPADANGDINQLLAGLQSIAGVTGGELFRPSGRVDSAMDQIDRATSAYYLVGFEPNDKERDGRFHKIELTLARKDLRIKARNGFEVGPADKPSKDAKKNPAESSLKDILHDNIRDYRDLPLRAAAFAFREPDATIKVIVLAETVGTGTMTSAAFAVISESGGQGAEWVADAADLAASPVLSAGAVQPGRYRVRVAATDALGRHGAVDVMLDAALAAAPPLQVSSLLPGRLENGNFQPRLDFEGARDITGLIELYNVPLLAGVPTARLELAATPTGPAIATAEMAIATATPADRRIARGTVAIPADAPAGNLVLRAQILLDGKVVGTVVRAVKR